MGDDGSAIRQRLRSSARSWITPVPLGDREFDLLRARNVGYDLSHFHRLTGWNLLNAQDDLLIGRAGCGLHQRPEAFEHFPLIVRGAPGPDQHDPEERATAGAQHGGVFRLGCRQVGSAVRFAAAMK